MVERLFNEAGGSWETCCYWLVAHYFGGRVNALPFELLAKSTDRSLLARWRDNIERIEALLFGQAGMLDDCFDDDYPRQLQADYQALRHAARLVPVDSHLWRFFRVRPTGFPTLRISQFARLVSQSHSLFSHLLEADHVDMLRGFFDVEASPYWTSHYRFDQCSSPRRKRTGTMFADTVILNAWIPLLFYYAVRNDSDDLREQAVRLLQQLPPEDNNIVRRWRAVGIAADNAAQSQAMIQLYNHYCSVHSCLHCPLCYYVIKEQPPTA